MTISKEIYIEPFPRRNPPGFLRLRALGRAVLSLPGLRLLYPAAKRALAVAEPAGRLSIRHHPEYLTAQGCDGITILSANLWHDWPRYRRLSERLDEFARLVEAQQADIILLQEVARTPNLQADEWLAKRLGMAYVYSRANGHRAGIGFEEGLAVFSRFPIGQPHLCQLGNGTNPFVRRLALGAAVESPLGRLLTFSVHLGLARRQNLVQLEHLQAWVHEVAGDLTAFVGGDFNAHEGSQPILQTRSNWLDTFRHLNPRGDGTTYELRWPWGGVLHRARLDYIFLKHGRSHWKVVEARHLDAARSPHSDHRAVMVRVVPSE